MEYTRDQILANREAWLQDLETTQDKKGYYTYFNGECYSALGRAAKDLLAILPEVDLTTIESQEQIEHIIQKLTEAYRFRDIGELVVLEDDNQYSFAEIAAIIRENPDKFFQEV